MYERDTIKYRFQFFGSPNYELEKLRQSKEIQI